MIVRSLLVAALIVAFSAPAFAFHCPADIAAINASLPKVTLSADQKAQVEKLRDEGQVLHNSGTHNEAQFKLAEAMRIILNGM